MQATLFITILFIVVGCNSHVAKNKEKLHTVYYRRFDIFKLAGSDTLKKIIKKGSVEVRYDKELPVYIKYYKPERTVTLLLEDSFIVKGKPVYVYSTSNFHGGNPGRNRVYTFHYEEYRDLLFINLSDTIICRSHQVTKLDYYSYTLYLYLKCKGGSIAKNMSGSNTKDDRGLSKEELYQNWLNLLWDDYLKNKNNPIIKQSIPE